MASSSLSHSLRALVVFRNLMSPALMRTVHVYRSEEGKDYEVEREYVFHSDSDYEEISFCKVFTLQKFHVSAHFEGLVNGVWLCFYVFDVDKLCSSDVDRLPTILTISRNSKLASIPTLANDLRMIYQLTRMVEVKNKCQLTIKEEHQSVNDDDIRLRTHQAVNLDLNLLPPPPSENEESDQGVSGVVEKRKKRAATKDIQRLSLEDLAKYFDLPIVEASKKLKVGLTVLKKKCREFGIPRWPHRKIKSLDSLIHGLQEEAERQQDEDKVAALLVAKRQKMIEMEKESIEKKPVIEIQRETKKVRQDLFKKRHRARLLQNQGHTLC